MITKPKTTVLDETIDAALTELKTLSVTHPDYQPILDKVKELSKLKETNSPKRVSPDTLALIGGNLAGILMIVSFEHAHVITSKALGFVLKSR